MFFSIYILFIYLISSHECRLPDQVICVNEDCSEPISKAKTLINYNSPDPEFISFRGKNDALILMKSAGTNSDIWYASINGQRGFINSRFLREYKIIEKNPEVLLTIDAVRKIQEVQPDRVQKPHEVFEGTTIFTTEPSPPINSQDNLKEVTEGETNLPSVSNAEEVKEIPLESNDESTTTAGAPDSGNIENILNQNLNVPDTEISADKLISTNTDTSNIERNINSQQNVNDAMNILGFETNENENISIETKKEIEKPELIDSITETGSNDIKEQPLVLTTNIDNNLNTLTTDPPVVVRNNPSESVETPSGVQNEVDNNHNILSANGVVAHEIVSNEQEESLKVQSDSTTTISSEPSGNKVAETILTNPQPPFLESIAPEELPHEGANTLDFVPPIPENVPKVSDYSNVPETVSPQSNTLPPTTDSITVQTIPTTTEAIPIVSNPISSEIVTPPVESTHIQQPPETETTPLLGENIVINNSPAIEATETTTPQVPLIEPIIPVPEYSSLGNEMNIPTTETIAATEPTPIYSNINDASSETDSPTIPEKIPNYYDSSQSTESLIDEIFTEATTETSHIEDNSEGFLSNIYTTLADMVQPATEAPQPDTIFNPDYVQNSEKESEITENFSFFNYIWATYISIMGAGEETSALFPVAGETCFSDEYCDGAGNNQNRFLTFLLTTASTVLLFMLGYYYIDNKRQDSRLIGNINNLQRELLFATKECEILKEELTTTKTKLAGIEDNSFGMDDMVQSLKEEINELKEQNERLRNSLDDNEKLLRVSENTASELQNTLGEVENTLSELLSERTNSEE